MKPGTRLATIASETAFAANSESHLCLCLRSFSISCSATPILGIPWYSDVPGRHTNLRSLFTALSKGTGPWAPWAENALGRLATDPFVAAGHWRQAAEDGFSIAMANLGMLYEGRISYAKAFPTDLAAAKMWYQAAAEHGREDAAFNLQRLRAATASKRGPRAFRAFEGLLAA